jgi:pleckstrin domain-containing family G protein 5
MTKYSLLLGAILKYTDDQAERHCLEEMITSVERFVMSVNAALRNQQESERLQGIMNKMEVYDVVVRIINWENNPSYITFSKCAGHKR